MSFGDALRNAAQGGDDFDPPNGTYTTRIVDASAFQAGDGREWCKVVHEVLEGPAGTLEGGDPVGKRFEHFGPAGNHNEVGLRIMAEALSLYGVELGKVEDLDDLGRAMFEVIGNECDLTVSHKNGYLRINVRGSRTGRSDIPYTTQAGEPTGEPAQGGGFAAAVKGGGKDDDIIPF